MSQTIITTHTLGFPRIGAHRELKRALENFWTGRGTRQQLLLTAQHLRAEQWKRQAEAGIDWVPVGDFSLYDHVLDLTLTLGAIPARYEALRQDPLQLYFAMARGKQSDGHDIIAMEMTKWFDTNYHYIVPEFTADQTFSLFDHRLIEQYREARQQGISAKPTLLGPISFLLLGKEKEEGFHRLSLIDRLLPVYIELLQSLEREGATWVQIDEPFLALDLDEEQRTRYSQVYERIAASTSLKVILATYFEGLNDNTALALQLPTAGLHIDLVRAAHQLDSVLEAWPEGKILSLGLVDGRNVWKNEYRASLALIEKAIQRIGDRHLWIGSSCSLLHLPYDLEAETHEEQLPAEVKDWMAFAYQKLDEIAQLRHIALVPSDPKSQCWLVLNDNSHKARAASPLTSNAQVAERVAAITPEHAQRRSPFAQRQALQHAALKLPLLPTTTIGSFPQTSEVRAQRAAYRQGKIDKATYHQFLRQATATCVRWQEEVGLDVLVHGEYERTDMVEYFGQQLEGFAFTALGWVQSYGSRCVKPPVIYGDVSRPKPMTVEWSSYAQSLTSRPMKGMLTGPITILQWSFVRNDQPRRTTAQQIALAIRDEVVDLESAGIGIIQIDEPAIREGLPLRTALQKAYLDWAIEAFRLSASGVKDSTQIHTHMCYSEFNGIIEEIAAMDADVITIECSRSQMELLDVFHEFRYPNEIGPGVYDIHSARVPAVDEMTDLLRKALRYIEPAQLWVNPDCGLKTRAWPETEAALRHMVAATEELRAQLSQQ